MKINKVGAFSSFAGNLKHVIVGEMVTQNYFDNINVPNIDVIKKICQETKEDLDNLAELYTKNNIKVERPKILYNKPSVEQFLGYNIINPAPNRAPHDHVFCMNNIFLQTFNQIERYTDRKTIHHVVENLSDNITYIESPEPEYWDDNFYDSLDENQWPGNIDVLLDGPTFYPCGKKVFYSERYACSPKGIRYLKDIFSNTIDFVKLNLPIKNHLDGQFRIIKPGHLISAVDTKELIQQIPKFSNWNITFDDSWKTNKLKKINNVNIIRDWIDYDIDQSSCNVGFVHLNDSTVVIMSENDNLCRALEKANVNWIVSPLRHAMFWNTSLSCCTAIIHREDECIDYLS